MRSRQTRPDENGMDAPPLRRLLFPRGFMRYITRRTLLGTIAAGFAAGPHLPGVCRGRIGRRGSCGWCRPTGRAGSDISLRILPRQFGRSLNQQFIVENKPGAGTRVANELVSRAAPDGYTFLYAAAPLRRPKPCSRNWNYNRRICSRWRWPCWRRCSWW